MFYFTVVLVITSFNISSTHIRTSLSIKSIIGHEHPAIGSTIDDSRKRLGSRHAICKSRTS